MRPGSLARLISRAEGGRHRRHLRHRDTAGAAGAEDAASAPAGTAVGSRRARVRRLQVAPWPLERRSGHRWRSGHHGGGEPRRPRRGCREHRPQHRAPLRAGSQRVHHARISASTSTTSRSARCTSSCGRWRWWSFPEGSAPWTSCSRSSPSSRPARSNPYPCCSSDGSTGSGSSTFGALVEEGVIAPERPGHLLVRGDGRGGLAATGARAGGGPGRS